MSPQTIVISDLHLGATDEVDLARRPELRAPLLDALAPGDRLVILGDAVELRMAAHRDAGDLAEPFFADVGRALGPHGELLVVGGNHDHGLVAGWIDGRLESEPPGFLGLEERFAPSATGPLAERLAAAARPAAVGFAYPGVWLRDDVYALHGHYMDVHTTVPTFERLAAGAMARWIVRLPEEGAKPDDYEAVLSPLYAWMHALTQRSDHAVITAGAGASARAWVALAGDGRRAQPVRTAALGAGYAAAVAGLNLAGLGPLERNLSGAALRRGSLRGLREALHRLGVRTEHVLFGHTHRAGPLPGDDTSEWTTAAGGRVHNAGSWVYQPHFLSGDDARSPYWPGTAIVVEEEGPPRLVSLLGDHAQAAFRPPVRA
jgi:Calcineurin-like phosphoesterase